MAAARAKFQGLHYELKKRFPHLGQEVVDEAKRRINEVLAELGNDGVPAEIREKIRWACDRLGNAS